MIQILADFCVERSKFFRLSENTYDLSGSGTSSIGFSLLGANVALRLL